MDYVPGWGDALAKNLPAFGQVLMNVLMPQKAAEIQLRQHLQDDPTLLPKLVAMGKDDPSSLERIYGSHAAAYINGLHEAPAATNVRTVDTAIGQRLSSDPASVADATQRGISGETAAQHTSSTINAVRDTDRLNALNKFRAEHPAEYNTLAANGGLEAWFGTNPNKNAVEENQAGAAKADTQARGFVDTLIANKTPAMDVWNQFESGKFDAEELGSIFSDERTTGLAKFIEAMQAAKRQEYDYSKTETLEEGRDRRAKGQLDYQYTKQSSVEAKANERQIYMNDLTVGRFLGEMRNPKAKLNADDIANKLPELNDLVQRNYVIKGLDPADAPHFEYDKKKWYQFGRSGLILLDKDGKPVNSWSEDGRRSSTFQYPNQKKDGKDEDGKETTVTKITKTVSRAASTVTGAPTLDDTSVGELVDAVTAKDAKGAEAEINALDVPMNDKVRLFKAWKTKRGVK
jgi:hypothetical protein